jgi:hypothetical protein
MYVSYERTTTSPSDLKNGAFSFFKVSREDTAMTLKGALKRSFGLFKVTWGALWCDRVFRVVRLDAEEALQIPRLVSSEIVALQVTE